MKEIEKLLEYFEKTYPDCIPEISIKKYRDCFNAWVGFSGENRPVGYTTSEGSVEDCLIDIWKHFTLRKELESKDE